MTVSGQIGNDQVILENAATEATLQLILKATLATTKAQKEAISNIAQKSGLDPQLIEQTNTQVSSLGKASAMVGGAFGGLTAAGNTLSVAFGNAVQVLSTLTDGEGKVSGFLGSLTGLPFGLGLVARGFQQVALFQEKNLDIYRSLTNAGVSFGGSLTEMRLAAGKTALSLDEFRDVLTSNQNAIRAFGGDTESGARAFVKVSNQLVKGPLGSELMAMGYSTKQINEHLANYVLISGGRTRAELQNTDRLARSAAGYMKQLDLLAISTGKSREELEEQQKAAALAADEQITMARMSETEREAYTKMRTEMVSRYGEAGRDMALAVAQNRAPLTQAGQMFAAMVPSAMDLSRSMLESAKAGDAGAAQFNRSAAQLRSDAAGSLSQIPTAVFSVNEGLQSMSDVTLQAAKDQQAGLTTTEAILAREKEIAAEKAKTDSEAAQAAQTELEMKRLQNEVLEALLPLFQKLQPLLLDGVRGLTDFVKMVLDSPTWLNVLKYGIMGLVGAFAGAKIFSGIRAGASLFTGELGSARNPIHVVGGMGGGMGLPGGKGGKGAAAAGAMGDIADIDGGGKGGKGGGFLNGIVTALTAAGRAAPQVLLGATALSGAIVIIGAGIAGATWIMSQALPSVAEGLKAFDDVNGDNLKGVGIGMAGLGAGILAMGAGQIVGAIGNIASFLTGGGYSLEEIAVKLLTFQKLDIDKGKVENNAQALAAFSKAMALANLAGGSGFVSGIGMIAEGIGKFFGGEPPFDKFVRFSKLDIDPEQTKRNATGFKHFSEAMAEFKGDGSSLGIISSALADAAVKFFGAEPPFEKFVNFSKLDIDAEKTKNNAKAFALFATAMAEYKGGPGLLDTISSLAGSGFSALFGADGPIEAFAKFAERDFGVSASRNSAALYNYAAGLEKLSRVGSVSVTEIDYRAIASQMQGLGNSSAGLNQFTAGLDRLSRIDTAKLDRIAESLQRIKENTPTSGGTTTNATGTPAAAAPAANVAGQVAEIMSPETGTTEGSMLNTSLQNMIRNLREISDNTRRTADLIASNGNLFRR